MENKPNKQSGRHAGGDPVTRSSKALSWLLRHGAREAGLPMDAAGWAPVDAVMRVLGMDPQTLARAVEENNKSRLQWDGLRIRACQGHSTDGTPVTAEALEASWEVHAGTAALWHGTSLDAVGEIARLGLLPMARTHVHLAETTDSHVGKRADVDVLLRVDARALRAAGVAVFRSPNGVLLARSVPPACLDGIRPVTRRARGAVTALEVLLPLVP